MCLRCNSRGGLELALLLFRVPDGKWAGLGMSDWEILGWLGLGD